jgi:hypothetical protein
MAKHTDRYSNENLINLATDKYEKTKRSTLPTEIVELTSKGKIYPESSLLSSGKIEMRYMTAYDEDILTNQSYMNEGIVFDKLLESLIVSDIDVKDIAPVDKDKLIIYARIVSYGKEYGVTVTDPKTKKEIKTSVDLSKIKSLPFTLESDKNGEFEYKVNDEYTIKFSYLKQNTESISKYLTSIITQVNDSRELDAIENFVRYHFLAKESKTFREYYNEHSPRLDYNYEFEGEDGGTFNAMFQVGADLFWF